MAVQYATCNVTQYKKEVMPNHHGLRRKLTMKNHLLITSFSSLNLFLCAISTSPAQALKSIESVPPTLAARYLPAMGYRSLAENYRSVLKLVEANWRISTSGHQEPCISPATEQAIEDFFEEICKNSCSRSLDVYLAQLELDIQVLNRLERTIETLPHEVRKLGTSMRTLRTALLFIGSLVQDHRLYYHGVQLLISIQNSFAREFSLLKSKELATLTTHLRSNAARDYQRDFTVSIERIKVAAEMTQSPYPQLAKELKALLENCERVKKMYEKS